MGVQTRGTVASTGDPSSAGPRGLPSSSTHVQDRPLLVTTKDTFPSFLTSFFFMERECKLGGAEGEGEPQAGFCSEQSWEDDPEATS